jgi:hypothetical protein
VPRICCQLQAARSGPCRVRGAFRGRIGEAGTFSASPIAADGHLYVASEDGEVYVVTASPGLKPIAKNDMKEVIMATPAISDGMIIVRTLEKHLRNRTVAASVFRTREVVNPRTREPGNPRTSGPAGVLR